MINLNADIQNEGVRRFMLAFEADDAAFGATLDPEVVWFPIDENRVPLRGLEAALRNRRAWLETWDEHRVDVDEVIEDGDAVVVSVHITGRGKVSGAPADIHFYPQFTARGGRVAYIYDHEDRAAALQAAGLS